MKQRLCNEGISETLEKYFDGNCTSGEEAAAREWLFDNIANPQYDALFERLLGRTRPDNDPESLKRSTACLDRFITAEQEYSRKQKRTRRIFGWLGTAVAASVAAIAFLLFTKEEPVQWQEIYTHRGETERIILADGTSLWINSDTKVLYPSRFNSNTRTIYIDGEIYADVTPDKHKPFIVAASDIRVKVHGTQFSVKAFSEMDNVEVALISGSVTMEDSNSENGFSRTLKPGELVRYNKTFGTAEDYRINPITYGAWQNNHNIRFINQSLADIAEYLEKRFDVEIVIEDGTLAQTQYYASFVNNEGLDKILSTLNSDRRMSISKKHDTIVISPNN